MTTTQKHDNYDVLVIGGGQSGLAIGYHLARLGVRFIILDAGPTIGHAWRNRWESLRLFTPTQQNSLPAMVFPGPADHLPTKDEVADYLSAYVAEFALPVQTDTPVHRLEKHGDRYHAHTSRGTLTADQVVVATGPFQNPVVPGLARGLDVEVTQMHSSDYRDPSTLPEGPVLVVGAGNSGRQIALELAKTRRPVTLAVGAASPQLPQRILGRDLFWWLTRAGIMAVTSRSRLAARMRSRGDLVIGSPLRQLRAAGVTLRPRVTTTTATEVTFADGTVSQPAGVVWATGFRSDYSWIEVPDVVVDSKVIHTRGVTSATGLYFLGLPWQHTRGSALLGFVQRDAAYLADHLNGRVNDHLADLICQ